MHSPLSGLGPSPLLRSGLPALLFASTLAAQATFVDRHGPLPAIDDPTESLALVDLDGDGDLDLLFGNGGGRNALLVNDGTGRFTAGGAGLPDEADPTCAILAADFDGDGLLDVFYGNGFGGSPNRLFRATAPLVFVEVTATHLPANLDGTEDAEAADLDGDGDLDLILANDADPGGQQNRVYLNDGTGKFTDATSTHMPADSESTEALGLGDVDGDGDLDAYFANDGAQNRLYLNNGLAVFSDATANVPAAAHETEALLVADLDGDGDLDLFDGNSGDGDRQNRLHLGDGLGFFVDATASRLPVDQDETEGLAVGDVDGDGDLDVYLSNFLTPDALYVNDGFGVFTRAVGVLPPELPSSTDLRLGDVDADGDLDAVLAHFDYANRLWLNDGAGKFHAPREHVPASSWATESLVVFDSDGDGDLDVLLGDTAGANHLLVNNGAALLTEAPHLMPPLPVNPVTRALAAGDVDGDGDVDVYVGASGPDGLLQNQGDGSFGAVALFVGGGITEGVALADLNGDGVLDAITASIGQNHLLLGTGVGTFTAAALPLAVNESLAVALGDVDGDGDLDVVWGNGATVAQANTLLLGNGLGVFTPAPSPLPGAAAQTGAVALGDVNADGNLDLFEGNGRTANALNRLALGNGAGAFVLASSALPASALQTRSVVLGDLDGDGDLDLALGNGVLVGQVDQVWWNDGAGVYTDTAGALPERTQLTAAVGAGDLDGDGDVDLVQVSILGQTRVVLNATRQLAWVTQPRIGKALRFALDGQPGDPWFLAYALQSTVLALPPYGTLYLNPTSLVVFASGFYDGAGYAEFGFPVPNDPAAVGLDLPWQAVSGRTFRLGNLERTPVTAL